jgi:phosphoglycerol transferase MdoB-like AlkP superfamily enzyme
MSVTVRAGLLLGVLVAFWTFVMGFTGWYKDPSMVNLFFLVIPLEISLLIWALLKTRADATYGRQVLNGLVFSLVAGVIIIAGSLLFTTVAFPSYFEDLKAAHAGILQKQGVPAADIQRQVDAAAAGQSPMMNAFSGFVGTVVTGVLVAATAGFFIRKK